MRIEIGPYDYVSPLTCHRCDKKFGWMDESGPNANMYYCKDCVKVLAALQNAERAIQAAGERK